MSAQMDNFSGYKEKIFKAGIYLRLSREDDNNISESIINQRNFLTDIVLKSGWTLVDIYIDDGYTGTDFERPGFKSLINDIEQKRVNLVITKDLSRLGRDYIQTGYYLERYFPAHDVRYIAVNDGIDTFSGNNSNNDMSPFKSVMNDMYAKDISKKVRTTMDTKRANGRFIGAFAPYGYLKSPGDKNKLITDPGTAPVIRRIFELYTKGTGYAGIANVLNDEGVPPPALYKSMSSNYRNPKAKHCLWTHETIGKILINPTYAGNLAQNKYHKINYKLKRLRNVPRQEWTVVENTHEAIIETETFKLVQELIEKKAGICCPAIQTGHLLSGVLFCGDCGGRMTFTATQKGNVYAVCSGYKRFKRCTRHSFLETELEGHILGELRRIAACADGEKLIKAASAAAHKTRQDDTQERIDRADKRLHEIKRTIKSMYEDRVKGILTEEDFSGLLSEYGKERENIGGLLSKLYEKRDSTGGMENRADALKKLVKDFVEFKEPDKAVLIKLVDRVEVFENNRIAVHYRFKKPDALN